MKKQSSIAHPLRWVRVVFAAFFFLGITSLFFDTDEALLKPFFGWLAKIQLLPAIHALGYAGVGIITYVIVMLLITLIVGRIYCSVVCPLGILQDIFNYFGAFRKRFRFGFSAEKKWLRYSILVLFTVLSLVGISSITVLISPYSVYGRALSSFLNPSLSVITSVIAFATLALVVTLAFFKGRLWCNTICPVGSFLSLLSRYALVRPTLDADKCTSCGLCSRSCRAECIDYKNHTVDSSRCVMCLECLDACHHGALHLGKTPKRSEAPVDTSRRQFGAMVGMLGIAGLARAQKTTDGGLAVLEQKKLPPRTTPIYPAGSLSLKHFRDRCTACQLCVTACPGNVLRPSSDLASLMQPTMYYDKGYCLLGCNRCSEVCPTGAITPIKKEEKSAIQIGQARYIRENCIITTDGVPCGNCARHCPTMAISMASVEDSKYPIPAVDVSHCIGCGRCENLCPARPVSAIYVDGYEQHTTI